MSKALHVIGMHGMGDNLHQRALVRQLLEQGRDIWLETSWPALYCDMPSPERLHFVARGTKLRTQLKNAQREAGQFSMAPIPKSSTQLRIHYSPTTVKAHGSVLGAMAASVGLEADDFRFRMLAEESLPRADAWLRDVKPARGRPLMIYRPLVERTEWTGCANRNPDADTYRQIVRSLASRFWTLSIADLVPHVEWLTCQPIEPDAACHRGELDVEILAGLFGRAALVVSPPGFAIPLAQAVGTPSVAVFGGYEDGRSFTAGARFTRTLAIEPVRPCGCWSHTHACDKHIDMPRALEALSEFTNAIAEDRPLAA